jgi:hypothetical protein
VDDFLLFADNKAILWGWKDKIEKKLASLRLTIHDGAHPIPVTEGFSFLGFRIFPQKRRLKRRKAIYYQRKLRTMYRDYAMGELSYEQLTASIQGWVNHAHYGNTVGLRKSMLGRLILPSNRE